MPGDVVLWPGLSGGEAIDLLGNLRGGLDKTRREELIERFELDPTSPSREVALALGGGASVLSADEVRRRHLLPGR